jgi:hypothetical protein
MPRLAIGSQSLSPTLISELICLNPQFFDSATQTLCLRKTTAGCQQNHVSIRLSTRDIFGTDIAAGPRPIVDNHRSVKPRCHRHGQQAGPHIAINPARSVSPRLGFATSTRGMRVNKLTGAKLVKRHAICNIVVTNLARATI